MHSLLWAVSKYAIVMIRSSIIQSKKWSSSWRRVSGTCVSVLCLPPPTNRVAGCVYLQVVGGLEQHTCHQVGVSPQVVETLLRGGAEHLHALSRGAQEEAAVM